MASPTPTPCPFDPELSRAYAALPKEYTATITPESISALQAGSSAGIPTPAQFIGDRPLTATSRTIPGYENAPIPATIITRADHQATATTAPAFYFLHGGGMFMGHALFGADFLLPWVEHFDGVLVAIDYRLAPAHADPYPVEDCYAGLVWLAAQGAALGFDARRIMVIGSSAGGGLAAGTTLLARDRRGAPRIAWQLLQAPMLDDRSATWSGRQYEDLGVWSGRSNETGWGAYLGPRKGGADVSVYAAPARAVELSGLPPTYLEVGSAEVFRDEVVAFAQGIWSVGGVAELHVWAGGFHGYNLLPGARLAEETAAARFKWARRMLDLDEVSGTYRVPL